MDHQSLTTTPPLDQPQHSQVLIRIGDRSSLTADVTVTTSGLLAIGALVSGILLSTAVLVRAARRR